MILIEINEDSGVSHYDLLEITREQLAGMDEKKVAIILSDSNRVAKRKYNNASQRGDKEAEAILDKLNSAYTVLKNPEERKKYDDKLDSGQASSPILGIQPVSPPFFLDRNARFRAVERFFRESGWSKPMPLGSGD
jgi:curved DNA-binding protein CbpA